MNLRSFLFVACVAHAAVAATSFPPPMSPEQPVSERAFGPAAGNQGTLAIASNGQIAFAVWIDQRRGFIGDLYGSRIGAGGVSLDPLGILIARTATGGTVFWNGTAFVVLSELGNDKTFSFVTPDGVIADRKSLSLTENFFSTVFAAVLGSGADARVLFMNGRLATIVDSQANVVIAGAHSETPFETILLAGAGQSEFLFIYTTQATGTHLFAHRVSRDGTFLGEADTGLDGSAVGTAMVLAGSPDGYLLVSRGPSEREVFLAHLDLNGVMKYSVSFAKVDEGLRVSYPYPTPAVPPAVLFDGDGYQILWTTSEADGSAHTWWAEEPARSGAPTLPHEQLFSCTGTTYGVAATRVGSTLLAVTDAFRAGVSTSIDPIVTTSDNLSNTVLSSSATLQAAPQVASSGNGYAVAWNEYGPDGSSHLYLRRFSAAGPVDAAPRELASDASGHEIAASITAAGDTYVIAWATLVLPRGSDYVLRRLSATTGEWLDAGPVPLANAAELVLGSNGEGAVAVYTIVCPSQARCLRARAIATDPGAPLRSNETIPAAIPAFGISIASNGHDYLIAWNDDACLPPCDVIGYSRFVASRLAADGTPLDAVPIVLESLDQFSEPHSIVWSRGNYLVSWSHGDFILCARISPSGLTETGHEVIAPSPLGGESSLVANGDDLLLLISKQLSDGVTTYGVAVDPQSLLAIGEPEVLIAGQPANGTVTAATLPVGVVIAYDRTDPAAADVPRVFTKALGNVQRRRAARQ